MKIKGLERRKMILACFLINSARIPGLIAQKSRRSVLRTMVAVGLGSRSALASQSRFAVGGPRSVESNYGDDNQRHGTMWCVARILVINRKTVGCAQAAAGLP